LFYIIDSFLELLTMICVFNSSGQSSGPSLHLTTSTKPKEWWRRRNRTILQR